MTLIKAADGIYCERKGYRSIITWLLLSRLTGLADSKLCQNSAAKLYNEARGAGLV
ncbi:MAG: hypothetical protein ACFFCS_23120 [Candidatus Hodarchaeota archaeon]